jgi:hypothetical protein
MTRVLRIEEDVVEVIEMNLTDKNVAMEVSGDEDMFVHEDFDCENLIYRWTSCNYVDDDDFGKHQRAANVLRELGDSYWGPGRTPRHAVLIYGRKGPEGTPQDVPQDIIDKAKSIK